MVGACLDYCCVVLAISVEKGLRDEGVGGDGSGVSPVSHDPRPTSHVTFLKVKFSPVVSNRAVLHHQVLYTYKVGFATES
jgi:hypothetical protein